MSRLARIVCDNPDCTAQVEWYANDYFQRHHYNGMDDTPDGWYKLTYTAHKQPSTATITDDMQPRYFCSVECVRNFTGGVKQPKFIESILPG